MNHPCFENDCMSNRIHLPVAPYCNISCGYCNKKMDCINESRPGVTSTILTPKEAYIRYIEMNKIYKFAVVGIAGPGDPLANYDATKETFNLINSYRKKNNIIDEVKFCLSTNGLLLAQYLDELCDIGVTYFTVTVNSLSEIISAQIYDYVTYDNKMLKGINAVSLLKNKQIEAIEKMSNRDIHIKINMVYMEGINDSQVIDVAEMASFFKCELLNLIPMIHVKGTRLYNSQEIDWSHFNELKEEASSIIPIMNYCMHCRADAMGPIRNK